MPNFMCASIDFAISKSSVTGLASSRSHISRVDCSAVVRVAGLELDDDVAADVDVAHRAEAECVQCVGDRSALRIENAATRSDMYGNAIAGHSVGPVGESGSGGPGGVLPTPGGRLPPRPRRRRLRRAAWAASSGGRSWRGRSSRVVVTIAFFARAFLASTLVARLLLASALAGRTLAGVQLVQIASSSRPSRRRLSAEQTSSLLRACRSARSSQKISPGVRRAADEPEDDPLDRAVRARTRAARGR